MRGSPGVASVLTIDRVLASPGQAIYVEKGEVHVEGRPLSSDRQPLQSVSPEISLERVLGVGQFAVIPTLVRWHPSGPDPDDAIRGTIGRETIVSDRDIIGRVVLLRDANGPWRLAN